jgi:hypothetical protein
VLGVELGGVKPANLPRTMKVNQRRVGEDSDREPEQRL